MAGSFKKKDIGYYVKSEAVIIQEREVILFFKVCIAWTACSDSFDQLTSSHIAILT